MSGAESFGVADYCVFVGMLVVSTGIGVYYAWADRKKQTNEEFLMGGKNMGVFPVSMSLMASFISSTVILGLPAEIYTRGSQFLISLLSCVVCTYVATEIFLPIFYKIKLTSVNEYLCRRYNSHNLQVIASVSTLLSMLPFLGICLFGPSLALGAVTKLSVSSCIFLMGIICTVYTALGGLKAVIWTDVVQFILMIAGILAVVIKGSMDAGGVGEVISKADTGSRIKYIDWSFNIHTGTFWNVFIGTLIMWTGGLSTSQMQVQRTCSLPSIKKAKMALYISMPGLMIMVLLNCFTGMIAYAYYYKCDPMLTGQIQRPDQIMPFFVMQLFSDKLPGLPGLFVACVFSSSLSTLSSGYNAFAAIAWEDFLKRIFYKVREDRAVYITKLVAAIIGALSVGIAFLSSRIGTIFEASLALSGAQLGPFFSVFILGVFTPWVNAIGATVGLLTGQISCLAIAIGAMVHRRTVYEALPTTTDGCDRELFPNITYPGTPFELLQNATIPVYSPEGMNQIYHISLYLVPVIGFIISITVAIVMSIITGLHKDKIDPELMNAKAIRFWRLFTKRYDHPYTDDDDVKFQMKSRAYSGPIPSGNAYSKVPRNEFNENHFAT